MSPGFELFMMVIVTAILAELLYSNGRLRVGDIAWILSAAMGISGGLVLLVR
jgi:hypothetical protein